MQPYGEHVPVCNMISCLVMLCRSSASFRPLALESLLPVSSIPVRNTELRFLDKFVRTHTLKRFGPVREVDKAMVLEIAFDSIHESARHKSGVAMRFPRIARIRVDKPAAEADQVTTLKRLVT